VPDNGHLFQDSTGSNTFIRRNQVWDVAEYGIFGDAVTDQTTRVTTEFTAASTAGIHTVTIKHKGEYLFGSNFAVPAGMYLQCGTEGAFPPNDVSGAPTGDRTGYPFLLPHPASTTFRVGGPTGGGGSVTSGCVVENAATYAAANPTTLQTMHNITGNGTNAGTFGGVGVTCGGDECRYADGMILGFTTGFSDNGHDTYDFSNTVIDATNCVNIANSHFLIGGMSNSKCDGVLTARLANGLLAYDISNIVTSPSNNR
jgi:hypothetical protein